MYMLEAMDYLLLVVMLLEDLTVAVKDMQVAIPSLVTAAVVRRRLLFWQRLVRTG